MNVPRDEARLDRRMAEVDKRVRARQRGRVSLGADRGGRWYLPADATAETISKALRLYVAAVEQRGAKQETATHELQRLGAEWEQKR